MPIFLFSSLNIFVFARAIILVSGLIPTLNFLTPAWICFLIISDPGYWSLILFFDIAHFKLASIGVVSVSKSFPYKQSPASKRNVSLAPKPINFDPFLSKIFVKFSAISFGIEISNPSSPVYPDLVI